MKLVSFSTSTDPVVRPGVLALDGDAAVVSLDVLAADMRGVVDLDGVALERTRELAATGPRNSMDDVTLHAPIVPKKFFHTAGNYREHHEEAERANFAHPVNPWIIFFQNPDAIIGPDEPIVYPPHLTRELDYELELAVVVGRSGKHFGPEESDDYILGYTIFNDITARDIQRVEMRNGVFSFCKAIDTFCPLGPWIVTADELPDPHHLELKLSVNGELRQDSGTWNMDFGVQRIVAHYSSLGYSAGDVLSTGTVRGVAAFSEDPEAWYLKEGDVVDAYIEGIGTLSNPIVSWESHHGSPPPVVETVAAYAEWNEHAIAD
jgi:2-keto-4-pentenoate hydratase/2-oxohepta-3-ene-1,7-dioic acid hydratase in catechol pathway